MKPKRYKVIGELFRCVRHGDIIEQDAMCKSQYWKEPKSIMNGYIPQHIIDSLPEFFEEIKEEEKSYEVLLFKKRWPNPFVLDGDKGYVYDKNRHDIVSVRRLSDGEIFAIGDSVDGGYKITSIKEGDTGICFNMEKKSSHSMHGMFSWLDTIKKDKEKSYEIISFRHPKCTEPWVCSEEGYSYDSSLHQIISVRRKSDGEVFAVGDFVKTNYHKGSGEKKPFVIKSFEEYFGTVQARFEHWKGFDYHPTKTACEIKNLTHHRKPLFRTFDGVDIFAGEKVWATIPTCGFFETDFKADADGGTLLKDFVCFSTQKARDEYIFNNKKTLSYKEVCKCIKGAWNHISMDELKEKVMEGLK